MTHHRTIAAVYQKPKQGMYYCGDSYFYEETDTQFICVVADGLGSGEYARESSQVVIDIVKANIDTNVKDLIRMCNKSLSGKRGVVLGLLKIDFEQKIYTFFSIGNIGIVTINNKGDKKRNIPSSGYLAGFERSIKVDSDDLAPGMMFVIFSDGVTDSDLSQPFMRFQNAQQLIDAFAAHKQDSSIDDTTMIAVKYTG